MRCNLKFGKSQITNRKLRNPERGYMLITLMLAFALIAIGLLAVLPEIGQQIKRDREEEMRHRGTAYMRAIQHFYKKTGRYPTRVEELENTNNIRFLRKRYKDPLTHDPQNGKEQDFKFLHQQDIPLNSGIILGGQMPGQVPGQMPGQAGLPGQAGFGGQGAGANVAMAGALAGLAAQAGAQQGAGTSGSPFNSINNGNSADSDAASGPNGKSSGTSGTSGASGPGGQASPNGTGSPFSGPTFGGGPIMGVASTSKDKSIRVFADKNHYKDWLFVYVPMADRGGLLVGPVQPGLPTGGNLNGAAGMPQGGAGQSSGFGQSSFGQSSGFGQSSFGQSGAGQGQGQAFGQNQGQPVNQSNPTPQGNAAPQDQ